MPDQYKELPTGTDVEIRLVNGELVGGTLGNRDDRGIYLDGHGEKATLIPWTAIVRINY
ncbi:hypothetical protein [Curtobacterium sp. MCPF17_003]|uniref:hypothetical protein n=1 Tax=Curtobacterium sp. MCPF17_003 TaxID=2175637 RepID=UPI0015E8CCBE|nr:hypothetical protein [Curtobacterium sp. MCPF17_003]